MMSKRDEFQARMDEALALWTARFEALKTKLGDGASPEVTQRFEGWNAARENAVAKLEKLKATSGDEWDAVKLEVDEAWHAIENVLDEDKAPDQGEDGAKPQAWVITKDEMAELTSEQQDAILEAMVIAVVADGKIGKDEISRFNAEIGKVPWPQPKEEVMKKAQEAQARVAALANDDERRAMLESIAARLPAGPIVEKTFSMMALVMTADKRVDPAEKNTLTAFALAFGISNERLQAIAQTLPRG